MKRSGLLANLKPGDRFTVPVRYLPEVDGTLLLPETPVPDLDGLLKPGDIVTIERFNRPDGTLARLRVSAGPALRVE